MCRTQFLVSNFHGPRVVDIAGAIVSMLALVLLLKVWQPKTSWTFEHDDRSLERGAAPSYAPREKLLAWMPWLLLSLFLNGGTAAARPHGQRHVVERAVRRAAADHRTAGGCLSDPGSGLE